MDTFTSIFSLVCGQGRAFVVDGAALPVCQRCFGLYAGALVTGLWLLVSGVGRRGLPHTREALAQAAMLLAAMAGGLHWIDAGPTWRLLCGLWTGHVAMVWLVAGAAHLRAVTANARQGGRRSVVENSDHSWPVRDRLQTLAAGPALAILAVAFTHLVTGGWWLWAAVVVLGAASLVLAFAWASLAALRWVIVRGARATHSSNAVPASAGDKSAAAKQPEMKYIP